MIQVTRWSPDTCKCVIEYQWDDSVPSEERVHTISKVVEKCAVHANTPDDESHYGTVLGENQLKNYVVDDIINNVPSVAVYDAKGNLQPAPGGIDWSFDDNRVLQVKLNPQPAPVAPGTFTKNQMVMSTIDTSADMATPDLQTIVDSKYGAGKVQIA